jgi:hypothetical protein
MDLIEVAAGPHRVVAFDGRVLEIFGGAERRFHVNLLSVAVPQRPDKHGNRNVVFQQAQVSSYLPVDEATFERLQPLLGALQSAGVPFSYQG